METPSFFEAADSPLSWAETLASYLDVVLYNLPVGVAIMEGPDLVFFRINRVLADIHQIPVEDHIGKPLHQVIQHGQEEVVDKLREVYRTGKPMIARELAIALTHEPEKTRHFIDWHLPIRDNKDMITGVLAVVLETTDKKEMQSQLKDSEFIHQALETSTRIMKTQEEVRARIARELHDDLGQVLLAQKMMLERLQNQLEPEHAQLVHEALSSNARCMETTRRVTHDLHPPMLQELGLKAAIEMELNYINKFSSINFSFSHAKALTQHILKNECRVSLYRIFQEATSNIVKHSKAKNANVFLSLCGDNVCLCMNDDGISFNPKSDNEFTLGLASMKERARQLGGRFYIETLDPGTRIKVIVPLVLLLEANPD